MSEYGHIMYAVIKSGGKQHRVKEGEYLRLEKLEVPTGGNIDFNEVLMVADGENFKIGAPLLEGAKVTGEVLSHGRADKVANHQISPPQASPEADGPPSVVHRSENHGHQCRLRSDRRTSWLTESWW